MVSISCVKSDITFTPNSNTMTKHYGTGLFIVMILALICCNKSYAQTSAQLKEIKKYGLVFRLQDYKRRIEYFESKGSSDRAKEEKAKIEQENRDLVQYFQQEFDFCIVRFYYVSQQEELLKGKPILLNSAMQPDAAIPLPEKLILSSIDLGEIVDNTFKWRAFRVVGTSIDIRPTYFTSWFDKPVQAKDVRRINRELKKMDKPKSTPIN